MSKARKIKFVVNVVKWFDKANGNTYHSCRITRMSDGKCLACPFTYGYGEHYRLTAFEAMIKEKWIKGYTANEAYGRYEGDKNYPIIWNVSDGKKRDCIENGKQ